MFPHVNVGKRDGVCRDFAVLGYCEKGYDCDKQHVRECPDFAENGTCSTKGCKLPHVIRANRGRKVPVTTPAAAAAQTMDDALPPGVVTDLGPSQPEEVAKVFAEDGHLGDEFISLTFHESESEEESEEEEEEEDDDDHDEEEDGEEEGGEEEETSEDGADGSGMT